MAFQKGHKKYGGRKKGSANEITRVNRQYMQKLAKDPKLKKKLKEELLNLEGKQFVDSYLSVIEFTTPKFNKINAENKQIPNITVNLIAATKENVIDIDGEIIESNREENNPPRLQEGS